MRQTVIEGKNIEEVKEKAIKFFKEPEDKLKIEVTNEKKGFLGIGSYITATVTLDIDPVQQGLNFLKKIMADMDIEVNIEMIKNKNEIRYNIYSNHNPLLIGKEGSTLDALQFLTRHIVRKYSDNRIICLVDIGGYKEKRKMQLEILATKVAKEVAKTKVKAKLDPMNSYERRVVHTKLSDWRDVYTESVGEEPHRCLVIKPRKRD